MTRTSMLILIIVFPTLLFSQDNFRLELSTKLANNTQITFAAPFIRIGFENLYKVEISTNENVKDFSKVMKNFPVEQVAYQIKIQDKIIIEGKLNYPVPYLFSYYDKETRMPIVTKKFYLEPGSYKIALPENLNKSLIDIDGSTNEEYIRFSKLFSNLYVTSKGDFKDDSLTNLIEKETIIANYVKRQPASYVALWEIIDDYSNYNFNPIYLENLKLFSGDIKSSNVFIQFENKLLAESMSLKGKNFPELYFNERESISIKDFNKSKITFIDYWATSCAPCIAAMPELVSMYNEYKSKGVNFITITDERNLNGIKLANLILKKNHVVWKNYFDIKRNVFNKLNINTYPTQFLVNNKGVIITRNTGNLKDVRAMLDEYLKSN